MSLPSEHFCPISDRLLGRLYRSSPEGITALVRTVPAKTRAMLAYYCSRRVHLQSLGIEIARTCTEGDLYEVAGRAGWDLFAQAAEPTVPPKAKGRHGVTLASGPLWKIPSPSE